MKLLVHDTKNQAPRSLPVRERGLKQKNSLNKKGIELSLPVRERGLKHLLGPVIIKGWESLPVRERGLKLRALLLSVE